jgi:hypothetical protein
MNITEIVNDSTHRMRTWFSDLVSYKTAVPKRSSSPQRRARSALHRRTARQAGVPSWIDPRRVPTLQDVVRTHS